MAKLQIECLSSKINTKRIAKAVYKILGQTSKLKAELVFLSEDEMRNLNNSSRGVDSVTDVLSFPTLGGIKNEILLPENCSTSMDRKRIFIGSIALCRQRIVAQAKEYGHSEQRETAYLIVHGLMHLFGYDHETEEEKAEMRDREKKAMKLLGVLNFGE